MLAGAILVAAAAIFVFFLRFWRNTGDRLFAFFAIAFLLIGVERLTIVSHAIEIRPGIYLMRLAAYLLIIFAVLQKNHRKG